jgi:hypothetical protein
MYINGEDIMNNNEKMSASRLHSSGNQHGIKFFMIVFLTIFISLLSACTTTPIPDPEPEPEPDPMDIVVEFPGDHLKEPVGTVTIGNETTDLAKLKNEKGDFYRFYEPLTKEEIIEMHKIHSDYDKKQSSLRDKIWLSPYGYDYKAITDAEILDFNKLEDEISAAADVIFEKIYKGEIKELNKFKYMFFQVKEPDGSIYHSFTTKIIAEVTEEEEMLMEIYVRYYNFRWDNFLKGVKERKLNYKPVLFSGYNDYIL